MHPPSKWRKTALPTEHKWTGIPPWTESLLYNCVTWPQRQSSEHNTVLPLPYTLLYTLLHTYTGGKKSIEPQQKEEAAVSLNSVMVRKPLIFPSVLVSLAMKQPKLQTQANGRKSLFIHAPQGQRNVEGSQKLMDWESACVKSRSKKVSGSGLTVSLLCGVKTGQRHAD